MKNIIKKLTFVSMTLSAPMTFAQSTMGELLSQLQINSETHVMELNVGQLVKIIQYAPLLTPICADFSGFNLNQVPFFYGQPITVNGIKFTSYYGNGSYPAARISEWPLYPGDLFLEMVEDGHVEIEFPVAASDVTLNLIQGAFNPNDIDYFSNGNHVGSNSTSLYNQVDLIGFAGNDINSVTIRNPELLIKEVCYQ